eukprot:gene13911-18422_t
MIQSGQESKGVGNVEQPQRQKPVELDNDRFHPEVLGTSHDDPRLRPVDPLPNGGRQNRQRLGNQRPTHRIVESRPDRCRFDTLTPARPGGVTIGIDVSPLGYSRRSILIVNAPELTRTVRVTFEVLEADKRPVSAVADNVEIRD